VLLIHQRYSIQIRPTDGQWKNLGLKCHKFQDPRMTPEADPCAIVKVQQFGRRIHLFGHIRCVLGSPVIILLQISYWMCRWKNYENRSIFNKNIDKSIVSPFLTHGVQLAPPLVEQTDCSLYAYWWQKAIFQIHWLVYYSTIPGVSRLSDGRYTGHTARRSLQTIASWYSDRITSASRNAVSREVCLVQWCSMVGIK